MTDFLHVMGRLEPRRRRRVSETLFGAAASRPSPEFLEALSAEIPELGDAYRKTALVFFAAEIELDAVYAAASAAKDPSGVFEDRRGMLEMDGLFLDAALAFETDDGSLELVLAYAKTNGKWSGRRFRRLSDRLRRVFGEDGDAFPGIRPSFVALGPDRPGPAQTASWPAWMRRADGAARWLPFKKDPEELSLLRCDKKGRPRRIGDYWRFDSARPVKS